MKIFAVVFFVFSLQFKALACDLLPAHGPFFLKSNQEFDRKKRLSISFSKQGTFRSSSFLSPELEDSFGKKKQYLFSNISQINLSQPLSQNLDLEFSLPVIYREYRRLEKSGFERDRKFGVGDFSIFFKKEAVKEISFNKQKSVYASSYLRAGVKLPTGSDDELKEELDEVISLLGGTESSLTSGTLVGGDDIALGTGSFDYVFGAGSILEYKDVSLDINLSYSYKKEGAHHYRFGNDFQWNLLLAKKFIEKEKFNFFYGIRLSGENKEEDKILGVKLDNTDERNIYLGPEFFLSFSSKLQAKFGILAPVHAESSSDDVVPKIRAVSGISYMF